MAIQIQTIHDLFWELIDSHNDIGDVDIIKSERISDDAFGANMYEYYNVYGFTIDQDYYPLMREDDCYCSHLGMRQNNSSECEFIGILAFTYHINFGNDNRGIPVENYDYGIDSGNLDSTTFSIIKNLPQTDVFSPFAECVQKDLCANGDFIALPLHRIVQGNASTISGITSIWNNQLKPQIETLINMFTASMYSENIKTHIGRVKMIKHIVQDEKTFDEFNIRNWN